MKKTRLLFLFCLIVSQHAIGQIGTNKVFDFAHLPSNARVTGLGALISVADEDVALAQQNPALANADYHNQLSVSHEFHFAGINYGYSSYGWHLDSMGVSLHAAAQYVSYGEFNRTNTLGDITGNFKASEVALLVGAAKKINDRISIGTNLKFLNAKYDTYGSSGIAVDIGLLYSNPAKRLGFGMVVKNIGYQINPLAETRDDIRYDIQVGMSKRLKHLPFRYSIIAHNLQQWNIRYKDPADVETDILGNVIPEPNFRVQVDNFFRHFIFNGEFLLGKREQFRMRFGYNHLRRSELKVATFSTLTGFSYGFGINIKKIKIDYGVSRYHLEGGSNHLTIRMNFVDMFRKV